MIGLCPCKSRLMTVIGIEIYLDTCSLITRESAWNIEWEMNCRSKSHTAIVVSLCFVNICVLLLITHHIEPRISLWWFHGTNHEIQKGWRYWNIYLTIIIDSLLEMIFHDPNNNFQLPSNYSCNLRGSLYGPSRQQNSSWFWFTHSPFAYPLSFLLFVILLDRRSLFLTELAVAWTWSTQSETRVCCKIALCPCNNPDWRIL